MIIPGTISAFSGEIDHETYTVTSGPWVQKLNFGPTPRNNTGWILCDGSSFPVSMFPELYAVIGNAYGGTPALEAKVPDYRGYFLRAITPDNSSPANKNRTPYSSGTSFKVGQKQEDMLVLHSHHTFTEVAEAGSGALSPLAKSITGPPRSEAKVFVFRKGQSLGEAVTGEETRPVNIYVNYIIYAGRTIANF